MLTSRQTALLVLLAKGEGRFRTLGAYADRLGVTARTLSGDLPAIESFLKSDGVILQRERGRGVRIVSNNSEDTQKLLARLQEEACYFAPEVRRDDIYVKILTHTGELVSINQLADTYTVSRTSIVNDLKEIETRLAAYGLALERTVHGTHVVGNESDMRRALMDALDARTRSFGSLQVDAPATGDRLSKTAFASLAEVFPPENISFLQSLLADLERETDTVIGDPYYINLITHLLICIDRVSRGYCVEDSSHAHSLDAENLGAYVHAIDIRNKIEERFGIALDDAETDYIFEYLVSFGVGVGAAELAASHEGRLALRIVSDLIDLARRYSCHKMDVDEVVRNEMLFHVRSMLNRVRYNLDISNDYLPHLSEEAPELLAIARSYCWALTVDDGCNPISDDEAAYLAMYCMAIVGASAQSLRVALVCQSGYGTSQFLHSRLARRFPGITVDVMSAKRFLSANPERYDCAVSTIRLEDPPVPTVFVSVMLDDKDIERIENSHLFDATIYSESEDYVAARRLSISAEEARSAIARAPESFEVELGSSHYLLTTRSAGEPSALMDVEGVPGSAVIVSSPTAHGAVRLIASRLGAEKIGDRAGENSASRPSGGLEVHSAATQGSSPFRLPRVVACAHLTASSREEVLEALAEKLRVCGDVCDATAFVEGVYEREALGSTVVAPGVAFPHGVGAGIERFGIGLATLADPVEWGEDGAVRLVALFAVPGEVYEEQSGVYVDALGALAELVDDPQRLEELLQVRSSAALAAKANHVIRTSREGIVNG